MTETDALQEIDRALGQRGFRRDWAQTDHVTYLGTLDCRGYPVHVSVAIPDLDLVDFPVIRPEHRDRLPLRAIPHLMANGGICYHQQGAVLLDRYRPGGMLLTCLDRAAEVLGKAVHGKSNDDFEVEFSVYWASDHLHVDLPPDYQGEALIYWVKAREVGPNAPVLTLKNKLAEAFASRHRQLAKQAPASERCEVISVPSPLTVVDPWPPRTLARLKVWLDKVAPGIFQRVSESLPKGEGTRRFFALRAPNGCCVGSVEIPTTMQTEEFLKTRRHELDHNLMRVAGSVIVHRHAGYRVDADYVFDRNIRGMTGLVNKRICLIGCGTIGGFLALQLAQLGAGAGAQGRLTLIDDSTFHSGNLGRHVLGVRYLNLNKAVACQEFLGEQLPHLILDARPVEALSHREGLLQHDLLIDATGEEALSIAINEFLVRKRPKVPVSLFVFLLANGAAAEALLCDGPEFACFKCLRPKLGGPRRFPIIKGSDEPNLVQNFACGDAPYAPFPVTRAIQAAALGAEMALAWSNGKPNPRHRSLALDPNRASFVKDSSPGRLDQCPACGAS